MINIFILNLKNRSVDFVPVCDMFYPSIMHIAWNMSSKMFDHEIQSLFSIEQWLELEDVPKDVPEKIKIMCGAIFPVKTKTVETLELILEYSLISSIQAQIMFVNFDFSMDLIISNSVYEVFHRLEASPIFQTILNEYRIMWYASKKIQFCWRRCISNPNFFICRRRLLREFNAM